MWQHHFSQAEEATNQHLSIASLNVLIIYKGELFLMFSFLQTYWSVFSRIQSKCGKVQTRKTPNRDTFYAVFTTYNYHLTNITYNKFEKKPLLIEDNDLGTECANGRNALVTNFGQ